MKILYISKYGDGLDIALRMVLDGQDVRAWIEDPKSQDVYDGLIKKVQSWQSAVQWSDLIVFDNNKQPEIWKQVHRIKPCFGGNAWGHKLEMDRKYAHQIMREVGLTPPEALEFKTIKEAIKHVTEHKAKHVIKPQGKKVESHHTFISHYIDGLDAVAMLERFQAQNIPYDCIEVEARIEHEKDYGPWSKMEQGVEVGISAWFNGEDWCQPICINFEHKHVMAGEIGPLCGEAGTLMKYDPESSENPLFLRTLDKFKPYLKKANYRGEIDLNLIVTPDGDFPLEFTPRLGYPAVFIESELHVTPWAKLFWDIANGKDPGLQVHYDWGVGVVLFSYGFPHEKEYMRTSHELPIFNVQDLDHIHLMQAKQGKNGMLVTASGEGYTLVSTGKGPTILQAKEKAYEPINQVRLPNSFYRFDISDKISPFDFEKYQLFGTKEKIG